VVWGNGTYHPVSGIGGASRSGSYVYLTGVRPGTHTVVVGS
jgi:hypothetical protein